MTAISYLNDFFSGRLPQRTLLRTFFPLILVSYFGSLMLAIWLFPGPFDWRTKSMSKLLYPRNNPQFHAIGSVGLAVAGLLMIPFAGYIARRLRVNAPRLAQLGALAFGAGSVSLILASAIVFQPVHEVFARLAGIGLGLGILAFYRCALKGRSLISDQTSPRRPLILTWSLIVLPALLVVMLRLLVSAHLQWSNPVYRILESRSLWHLGFWEWMISVEVFLFMLGATLFLPEDLEPLGSAQGIGSRSQAPT
jgi:hypothetical protein